MTQIMVDDFFSHLGWHFLWWFYFLSVFFLKGLKPSVDKIHPYICLILERKKPESLTTISASAPNHEMDQDEPWQRFTMKTMASKWEVERNLVYINWIKLNWIHFHIAFDLATNKLDGSWLGKCGFRFELILVTRLNSSPENLEGTDRGVSEAYRAVWALRLLRLCRIIRLGKIGRTVFVEGGWAGRSGHRLRSYWYSVKQWHDIMYNIYIYNIWNGLSRDLKSLELQMRWFSTRGNRVTTNLHQCCTLFKLDDTWVLCTWLLVCEAENWWILQINCSVV